MEILTLPGGAGEEGGARGAGEAEGAGGAVETLHCNVWMQGEQKNRCVAKIW